MPIWTYTPLKTIVSGYTKAHGTAMTAITFVNKKEGKVRNPFKREVPTDESDLLSSIDDLANEDKNEFNDTLNFIVGLSDDDYDKMLKCAKIYREADKKVAPAMEVPAPMDGEKIEVRVEKSTASDFIETDDDKKGKKASDAKAK